MCGTCELSPSDLPAFEKTAGKGLPLFIAPRTLTGRPTQEWCDLGQLLSPSELQHPYIEKRGTWPGGSAGWCVVPYTKRLYIPRL